MATYSALLDLAGNVRVEMVRRDDGAFVFTGKVGFGDAVENIPDFDDKDGLAYRAWLDAGGKLGDAVPTPRVREATSYALVSALSDDEVAALSKAKAKDQRLFNMRPDPFPEDNPKVGRIAAVLGLKPAAWFDRALGATA